MNLYSPLPQPADLLTAQPATSQHAIHNPLQTSLHPQSIVTELPLPPGLEAGTSKDNFLDSLSNDDKELFENYDRFLRGEISQKEFQAHSFKRMLFIWDWVLHLCFNNRSLAIQAWHEILEKEDIWLWSDGDEGQAPDRLDNRWDWYGDCWPKNQLDDPPRLAIQGAMEELRCRLQNANSTSKQNQLGGSLIRPKSICPHSSVERSRLTSSQPQLRYFAIIWIVTTSNSIMKIDRSRGISGRTVRSLLNEMNWFTVALDDHPVRRKKLEVLGHSCVARNENELCLLLDLLDIVNPHYLIQNWKYAAMIDSHYPLHSTPSSNTSDSPLQLSEIAPSSNQYTPSGVSTYTPPTYLRFLWRIWMRPEEGVPCTTDVGAWLDWLASLAQETTIPRKVYTMGRNRGVGVARILRYLKKARLEEWILSESLSTSSSSSIFGSQWIYDGAWQDFTRCTMHVPAQPDWEEAERIIELATANSCGANTEIEIDYRTVIGVILCWVNAVGKSVTSAFPDFFTFSDLFTSLDSESYEWLSSSTLQTSLTLPLKRRILQSQPSCCGGIDLEEYSEELLDLYITSAILMDATLSDEMMSKCRPTCRKTLRDNARSTFDTCVNRHRWAHGKEEIVGKLLDDMVRAAVEAGFDRNALLRKINDMRGEKVDTETQTDPLVVSPPAVKSAQDLRRSQPPGIQKRISKSSQVEAVKTHIINLLTGLELVTSQIPALIPRKNQQPSLPWKNLTQILTERGYELENWPSEVPLPGSGSPLCDDNKGVHGLNAKHLRLLYDATQSEERPLRFRKVRDMIPAPVLHGDDATRWRGSRVRGREDDDEDMAGPSKRGRLEVADQGSGFPPFISYERPM